MKWILTVVLSFSCLVAAQNVPRYELSTGYSYGSTANPTSSSVSGQGWFSSFGVNLKPYIGLETDVSAQYNNETVALQSTPYSFKAGYYSFLSGPRVAYRRGRVTPFVHGLLGINRSPAYDKATFGQTDVFVPYGNYFGAVAGGGLEYSVTNRVAFRSQADYFLTGSGMNLPGTTNNFRIVGAIVFSFGGSARGRIARKNPSVNPTSTSAANLESAATGSNTSQPITQPTTAETESSASQPMIQPTNAGTVSNVSQPIIQPTTAGTGSNASQPMIQPTSAGTVSNVSQPITQPTTAGTGSNASQPMIQPTNAGTVSNVSEPITQPTTARTGSTASQPMTQPTNAGTVSNVSQPIIQPTTAVITSRPWEREVSIPSTKVPADINSKLATEPATVPAAPATSAMGTIGATGGPNASPGTPKAPTESRLTNAGSLPARLEKESNRPEPGSSYDAASSEQWQKPAQQQQESLGEIARRYREQKNRHEANTVLSSDQSQNSTQQQESLGDIARRYREQKKLRQMNQQ